MQNAIVDIDFKKPSAWESLAGDIQRAVTDALKCGNPVAQRFEAGPEGLRIVLREPRNPLKSANGGDYREVALYEHGAGRITRRWRSSCEMLDDEVEVFPTA